MKKCLSVILTLTMVLAMLAAPVYANATTAAAKIICPAMGEVLYGSEALVAGMLPEACETASILIDGVKAADVTAQNGSFSETVDISSLSFGIHKITLEANGEAVDTYVTVTSASSEVLRGTNYTGGTGATSSNMGGWGCSFSSNLPVNSDTGFRIYKVEGENGTIGRTYAKKNDGYIRVTMNNNRPSETINTGVFKLESDFSLTGDMVAFRVAVTDRGGSGGTYLLDNIVGTDDQNNNVFTDHSAFETGKTYHLVVLIDIDRQTRTYIVDDKVMVCDKKLDRKDVLTAVDHFNFELTSHSSKDATMTISNLNLTTIERFPFITKIGDKTYDKDAKILCSENAVNLTLSNAVDTASINADNVVLKKDGADVDATATSKDGKTISVTPAGGFEAGASYSVEMSNLVYKYTENNASLNPTYPKTLVAEFDAVSEFVIVSPVQYEVFGGINGVFETMVPEDYTDAKFYIDGIEINGVTANGVIYTFPIVSSDYNIGYHLFEVVATKDGETERLSRYFKVADFISEVREEYPILNTNAWSPTVVSQCEGSDGSENGGYRISANNANAYYNINFTEPKLSLTGTVVFEADIKRDTNSNIYMIARKTGISNGSLVTDRNFVMAADGKLVGTDIKVPVGEWHNYRIVTNLATKEYKLYYDRNLVAEGVNTIAEGTANAIPSELGFLQLQVWCPTSESGMSVDNVKLYAYEIANDVYVSEQAKDGEVMTVKSNTVSAMADTITADLSRFDAIDTSKVSVTAGGKAVTLGGVSYDADSKKLTVKVADLPADSVLNISIDGVSINGKALSKTYDITAKINCDKIGDITVDGKTASVILGKGRASSYAISDAKLIIASYSGNKLVGVTFGDAAAQTDKLTLNTVTYDGEEGGSEYKAFLWDSFGSLKPIK